MNSVKKNLDTHFERNLKWKLLKKAYTSVEGLKVLINAFRHYDLSNTGKINRDNWVDAILTNGLVIGISREDLSKLFDKYKEENSELIDYKKFGFDIFFKYNKMSLTKGNLNMNNFNQLYNHTESMDFSNNYNNNSFININETSANKSQKFLNVNNNLNNSYSLNNKQFENIRYNYRNSPIKLSSVNNISGIDYSSPHSSNVRNSINYFRTKININNGLNYYRFISDLKSKCSFDNTIFKNFLPIALQNVGVFYTQKELSGFYYALGCEDITTKSFSFSKIISLLKDEMNEYRKNIVTNLFYYICKTENINNNEISLKLLKEKFRPEMHPEVLNKKRSPNDIYIQFSDSLDIFAKLNNILNNINLDQFIDFYSGISSSIFDDRYFSHIINNVWNFNENNNNENYNNVELQKNSNSPKVNNSNLNIDKFNFNYNNNANNLNQNNYNKNDSIKDKVENNSHTKINLPLFYYNRNDNLNNNLSKSYNISENNDFYKDYMNLISTPIPKSKNQRLNQYNEPNNLNDNNQRNISGLKTPSYKNLNANLMNQDLNLISSNNNHNKDISPVLNKLKETFILQGMKSVFYFQRMLYVYDINRIGEISFSNLKSIIQAYNYNFSDEELKSIFNKYDRNNTGMINYNELFVEIIGNMDMMRFTLVKQLFDAFPKNEKGNINIDIFKRCFYPSMHYDVLNGNKTTDEIYKEFLECLEIFMEYNFNLKGDISKKELTYEEFCDFFGEISLVIQTDNIFSNFMQNCWKLNNMY